MSRTLQSVLKSAKQTLEQSQNLPSSARVVFTVGNQAADADSIVSSLGLAAVLSGHPGLLPVPLASCSRINGRTKPELQELLQQCGVEASDLVYLDDVDWATWQASSAGVILLDHNAPEGPLTPLAANVCCIIDHHVDAGSCAHVTSPVSSGAWHRRALAAAAAAMAAVIDGSCPANARAVTMNDAGDLGVGSACTLVGHAYLSALQSDPPSTPLVPGLAQLLATVVCLDTNSLKDSSKTTPADVAVLHRLDALMLSDDAASTAPPPGHGTPPLSDQLLAAATAARSAKFDPMFWSNLALVQALEYDLKVRTVMGADGRPRTVAMASVLCPLPQLLRDRGGGDGITAAQQLDTFATAHSADVVVLMSLVLAPRKARQLAVYTPPTPHGASAGDAVVRTASADTTGMQLERIALQCAAVGDTAAAASAAGDSNAPSPTAAALCKSLQAHISDSARLLMWQQGKLGISRKQLLPLLEAALQEASEA